jgi:hypothetical protein
MKRTSKCCHGMLYPMPIRMEIPNIVQQSKRMAQAFEEEGNLRRGVTGA